MAYVYDMTWAEFCIRSHAYKRFQKNEWYKIREIAYYSMIGSHMDSKKLPKTKELFMPLDGDRRTEVNETMINAIRKAKKQYQQDLKQKQNG